MSREEFREMFNHELYDRMRAKYDAVGAFPEVYDKIKPEKGVLMDRPEFEPTTTAGANGNGNGKKAKKEQ